LNSAESFLLRIQLEAGGKKLAANASRRAVCSPVSSAQRSAPFRLKYRVFQTGLAQKKRQIGSASCSAE
jgi:hypothetical protein